MLLPDDIEVSPSHLKRFNGSVIDPECLLKIAAISFCFFSNIIFFCILLFLFERYGLHAFQNGLELQSALSFSKYCKLAYFFRFSNRFCCHLNLTMSLGFSELFALFLLKWGF